MRGLKLFSLLMILVLLLAACGGGGSEEKPASEPAAGGEPAAAESTSGDAAAGETLFNGTTISSANLPGCATCHSLEADVKLVGPSLHGIASKGEDFIRESITAPNANVTEGFTEGLMPQNYAESLTPEEINNLVAFLMTK